MTNIEPIKIKNILNAQELKKTIEALVKEKGMDYMEACLHFCETNNIEIETVASVVKSSTKLKAKLKEEALSKNLLKK